MADFSAFRELNRVTGITVQTVLQNIDTPLLAVAMITMPEEDRNIFYQNMTPGAVEELKEEIAECERLPEGTYDEKSGKLQDLLLSQLESQLQKTKEDEDNTPVEVPHLKWKTEDEIIHTFVQLKRYVRRHGPVALQSAATDELHPLLLKGLRLFLDGWDASSVQAVLEQLKESIIISYTNRMNMMIEGIGALQNPSTSANELDERLQAFCLNRHE